MSEIESSFRHTPEMAEAVSEMNRLGEARVPFLFVIDYEMAEPMVVELSELERIDVEATVNWIPLTEPRSPEAKSVEVRVHPVPYSTYECAFRSISHHFVLGNSYLANLTFRSRIETDLTLSEIYSVSEAKFKLRIGDRLVVFSPETFVRIAGDQISSFPMKGTIDAETPNARSTILEDEKERAEHVTVVDLIRNDIGMVADSVSVERFRFIDTISTQGKTLLQVSSEIRGQLASDWPERIGTVLATLLPAGSICGAPKRKTVEIIRQAESGPRGYYTGVFGVFDGSSLESAVMIRYIERSGDQLFYRSGGGITIYSDPEKEYQELIDKIYVPVARNDPARKKEVLEPRTARSKDEVVARSNVRPV